MSEPLKADEIPPPSPAPAEPVVHLFDPASSLRSIVDQSPPTEMPPPTSQPGEATSATRRPRGRPPKKKKKPDPARSAAASKANETRKAQAQQPPRIETPAAEIVDDRENDAIEINMILFTVAAMVLGPEVTPNAVESDRCNKALAIYLRRYPRWKPRPELALLLAYAGWLGAKVDQHPTVRQRLAGVWVRARGLFADLWTRVRRRKPSPATSP